MCRLVAKRLGSLLPHLGLRQSHMSLQLERHAAVPLDVIRYDSDQRRALSAFMLQAAGRLSPQAVLYAMVVALRWRVSGTVLSKMLLQLQAPRCVQVFQTHPERVHAMAKAVAENGEARELAVVSLIQHTAEKLAEHVSYYGNSALQVLSSLGHAGGFKTLRSMQADQARQLVHAVCKQAQLLQDETTELGPHVRPQDAASLLCLLNRISHRDTSLNATLCRFLSANVDVLQPSRLPELARTVGRGGHCSEFVLLHGICRQSSDVAEMLDGASIVSLLKVFSQHELYDERFLEAAAAHFHKSASSLPASQLGDAMYALSNLQVRQSDQLDVLCEALVPKVHELSEGDVVRFLRGLVKMRHTHQRLTNAMVPYIDKSRSSYSVISLTNIISAFSFFGRTPERFFQKLLDAVTIQVDKLSTASVQHIFTALCRQQGRLEWKVLSKPLNKLCKHLTLPEVARQLTPVQAVGSLAALAKLQYRDLEALSVLLSVLVGRQTNISWDWAPSACFYSLRAPPSDPFVEEQCLDVFANLDVSHRVEVLQSIHRLELHSSLTRRLAEILCGSLFKQLHELRAREVLAVGRVLAVCQLPQSGMDESSDINLCESSTPQPQTNVTEPHCVSREPEGHDAFVLPRRIAQWRERAAESCFESLRRHQFYLECSWNTLLPFKLLCMEIDAGTFGTRRLCHILNPTLLSFVDRLRSLTRAECEANRLRREGTDDEDSSSRGSVKDGEAAIGAIDACEGFTPTIWHSHSHRIVIGGFVSDVPVDVLVEHPDWPINSLCGSS